MPDLGLLSMTEVLVRLREVIDAVEVPVLADADTGYGGVLNVRRTVREMQRLGVAGLHIEDQLAEEVRALLGEDPGVHRRDGGQDRGRSTPAATRTWCWWRAPTRWPWKASTPR